jgi:predicted RNA-binding Zn-ribbon protein involved in translation (DUF1610 family)
MKIVDFFFGPDWFEYKVLYDNPNRLTKHFYKEERDLYDQKCRKCNISLKKEKKTWLLFCPKCGLMYYLGHCINNKGKWKKKKGFKKCIKTKKN